MSATRSPATARATPTSTPRSSTACASSDVDVVLNLTAGMGGDLTFGSVEQPLPPAEVGTDLAGATERLEHVRRLMPEICTLDCGTMNFGEGDYIMTNSTSTLKEMARQIQALGVRPEIEAFDTGHLWQAKSLVGRGADRRSGDDPALHGRAMGRATRPQHVHGDGQQRARVVDVERVLARPAADGVRRAGGDRRWQHPRRARGQPVPRPRPDGEQRRPRRPGRSRSSTASGTRSRAPRKCAPS